MSFLDDIIQPNDLDQGVLGKIETLIWYSSLDEKQKAKEMKKMLRLETIEEAYKMVNFLQDFQPIPGRDRIAITQYEIVTATKNRADIDDYYDRTTNTTNAKTKA